MLAVFKLLSGLLLSLSIIPALSEPVPLPAITKPPSKTCPLIATVITTVTTIKTKAPAPCPTYTFTNFPLCLSVGGPPCTEPLCIIEKTTTIGCAGVCCPKKTPTVTEQFPCVPTCRTGCATTVVATKTVGC